MNLNYFNIFSKNSIWMLDMSETISIEPQFQLEAMKHLTWPRVPASRGFPGTGHALHNTEQRKNRMYVKPMTENIAKATHLPFRATVTAGVTNERLLHQEHYIINNDDDLKAPTWMSDRFRDSDIAPGDGLNYFRRDIRLPDPSRYCEEKS